MPQRTAPTAHREVAVPSAADRAAAREVIAAALAPSPLVPAPKLHADACLKLESLQPTGSFKVRGALAMLAAAPAGQQIVTASAGNHALGVAWAATRLGRTATIVVPETVSPAKLAGLRGFGDVVAVECVGDSFDDAEARALELAAGGATYVSAYNDTAVIAGQSTIGEELDALGRPITVLVPIGGGGLLAGLALWAAGRTDVRLVGVEVEASQPMSAAIAAGAVTSVVIAPTLADGVAGNIEPGSVTVPIVRDRVDELVVVGEAELREAIRFLAREHGLVAEGAGALATAALLADRATVTGTAVALVTGRNIALPRLTEVLNDAVAD